MGHYENCPDNSMHLETDTVPIWTIMLQRAATFVERLRRMPAGSQRYSVVNTITNVAATNRRRNVNVIKYLNERSEVVINPALGEAVHAPREPVFVQSQTAPWQCLGCSRVKFTPKTSPQYSPTLHADDQSPEAIRATKWQLSNDNLESVRASFRPTYELYTDGSASLGVGSAGAAILYDMRDPPDAVDPTTVAEAAGLLACSYRAECFAMFIGLRTLCEPLNGSRILIATDSQSLLMALSQGPLLQTEYREDLIWSLLLHLVSRDNDIHFVFIHGHCGIPGNEAADQLANQAACEQPQHTAPVWFTDAKSAIKRHLNAQWRSSIAPSEERVSLLGTIPTNLAIWENVPRKTAVLISQLLTNNCKYYGTFPQRMGWNPTGVCRLCHAAAPAAQSDPELPPPPPEPPPEPPPPTPAPPTSARLPCPHCHKTFASRPSLSQHLRKQHDDVPAAPSEALAEACRFCQRQFKGAKSRARHEDWCDSNPQPRQFRGSVAEAPPPLPPCEENLVHLMLDCPRFASQRGASPCLQKLLACRTDRDAFIPLLRRSLGAPDFLTFFSMISTTIASRVVPSQNPQHNARK